MSIIDRIPSDLPKTDPLLFSFLMILDALKMNVRFNGKYSRSVDKLLPAFEYGVNKWKITEISEGIFEMEQEVMAAFWTGTPIENDCNEVWGKFPNNDPLNEKPLSVQYAHRFEEWRLETFNNLYAILGTLIGKGVNYDKFLKVKNEYLAETFGWEIVNNEISFVYAKDSTANKYYGVGAVFTLKGNYKNCCPRPDAALLTKAYFKDKGFVFE
jgi:hypothetical protein